MSQTDFNIQECFDCVLQVAKDAGKIVREAFYNEKRVETKSCAADLVTETDQQVEKLIISTLKTKFPTHSFIGEESVAAGEKNEYTDNPTWIIDPIDGTTNFVHSFPYTCISIGLTVKKKVVIGLIYNPILGDMYTAQHTKGAFLNNKPIHVTTIKELTKALICTEFGSSRDLDIINRKSKAMNNVIMKAHGLRCTGSAALNLCMVACGSADGYYHQGIHCWDIAAGELIVREAGGVAMDITGGPLDLMSRRILVAGTQELADQIVPCMVHIDLERD